jgi:glucokinase
VNLDTPSNDAAVPLKRQGSDPAGSAFTIPFAIGCDIGVTHVKTVCVSHAGTVLARHLTDTNAYSPDWPAGVKRHLEALESTHGRAEAVGVAAPGIAHPCRGAIYWMQGRLDAVEGLNWTRHLERAAEVPVLNDAQAALLGEVWQGAARGSRNVAMLTLGTGVGGALMVDGNLLRGHLGRAGHLGHISLDAAGPPDLTNCPGSLEHAVGNVTVGARTAGRFRTTHELVAAHLNGDEAATSAWLRSVRALAAGVASIINVADPEVFIIGGGIARAGPALFEPLRRELDELEWRPHGSRVRVVPAALGEYAGALGAACHAIRRTDDPEGTGE